MNWTNFLFRGVPMPGYGVGSGAFQHTFKCHSMAVLGKPDLENGGKIILPASALEMLARLRIEYPMLFEISHPTKGNKTHCGVLEFTATEGTCGLPFWMMKNLEIEEGGFINVKSVNLQKGTFVKLQPMSSAFYEISNPKAVLEMCFRNFAALTQGDILSIQYLNKTFYLSVLETKPAKAISIIETDINLDFAPAPDYKEPTKPDKMEIKEETNKRPKIESDSEEEEAQPSFKPFTGTGYSLKGKSTPLSGSPATTSSISKSRKAESDDDSEEESDEENKKKFKAFTGTGYSLKGK